MKEYFYKRKFHPNSIVEQLLYYEHKPAAGTILERVYINYIYLKEGENV